MPCEYGAVIACENSLMDETRHISEPKLWHYLIHAMPLTEDETAHLAECEHCRAVLVEFQPYAAKAA